MAQPLVIPAPLQGRVIWRQKDLSLSQVILNHKTLNFLNLPPQNLNPISLNPKPLNPETLNRGLPWPRGVGLPSLQDLTAAPGHRTCRI